MMLNNNRQYPTGNGPSKTNQLPNKALLHQVVSATQSWSSQNAVLGSLQPYPGTNSTAWRQQGVPHEEPGFPLRKTLSVPAYFRSPNLHTPSYIPNTGKGTKKSSPPPTSPLLVHESPTLTAPAYPNALSSHPSRQLNLSQWSEFDSTSEASSTPSLWSTQHASLPLKRSHSSGAALKSPLTSPAGKREAQTRQGMSPKCLSLPAMSPGNRDVGRYGNIPVPRSLLPSMSESPTRSSPKPGRNLSTPPAKKKTLRHRKLGYPETNSNNNQTQEKTKIEDVNKPKKCSQRSFILPLIVVLTICAVVVIAVQLYFHDNVNEGKHCSISALEEELNQKLFGQHVAKRVVLEALSGHLAETHGSAPLVMSFLGPSGVGKTFVSRIVSTFLSESCEGQVHEFIIPHHFPHPEEAQLYTEQVRHWVKGNISHSNQRHLFVFDEMEKVYPKLAEGLLSLLEEDTSNSMYIFVYSTEELSVSRYLLEQLTKGRSRESIREDEIQDLLKQVEQVPKPSGTDSISTKSHKTATTVKQHRNIPEGHAPVNHHATMATALPSTEDVSQEATDLGMPRLVWPGDLGGKSSEPNRYLVPFLPLEREHVLKCAEVKLATDGRMVSMETAQRIVDEMQFYPRDRPVFSKYGCKRLSVRVDMSKDN